jgi:TPR repeat protein
MRREAEDVRAEGWLEHAPSSGDVRSTQQLDDLISPTMVFYSQAITEKLSGALSLPLQPGTEAFSTKLAVVESDGASYRRHLDNSQSSGDPRKVTVIYYLNMDYETSQHGELRAFSDDGQLLESVAPRGDRMVAFWSDSLVHEVAPTALPEKGPLAAAACHHHRWALTVWLRAADFTAVHPRDPAVEDRHFGTGAFQRHRLLATSQSEGPVQHRTDAEFELAECYLRGRGVEQDVPEAVSWYQKAASAGHAKALHVLGTMYGSGGGGGGEGVLAFDSTKSVEMFQAAANLGHADAAFDLASAFTAGSAGVGGTPDDVQALKWYRVAADAGHAKAQYEAGYCFGFGVGCERDESEAARYLMLAKRQSQFLVPPEAYPLLGFVEPM